MDMLEDFVGRLMEVNHSTGHIPRLISHAAQVLSTSKDQANASALLAILKVVLMRFFESSGSLAELMFHIEFSPTFTASPAIVSSAVILWYRDQPRALDASDGQTVDSLLEWVMTLTKRSAVPQSSQVFLRHGGSGKILPLSTALESQETLYELLGRQSKPPGVGGSYSQQSVQHWSVIYVDDCSNMWSLVEALGNALDSLLGDMCIDFLLLLFSLPGSTSNTWRANTSGDGDIDRPPYVRLFFNIVAWQREHSQYKIVTNCLKVSTSENMLRREGVLKIMLTAAYTPTNSGKTNPMLTALGEHFSSSDPSGYIAVLLKSLDSPLQALMLHTVLARVGEWSPGADLYEGFLSMLRWLFTSANTGGEHLTVVLLCGLMMSKSVKILQYLAQKKTTVGPWYKVKAQSFSIRSWARSFMMFNRSFKLSTVRPRFQC
jgi:hypothetical protein